MADPAQAAHLLVQHMLCTAGTSPGIHVFVTHDSLITATAARMVGARLGPEDWPWYLEAAFFSQDDDGISAAYRSHVVCGIALRTV